MGIMERKRREMKKEFLALTPDKRIQEMESLFNEFVKLRAKREEITEGEAYLKYAERAEKRPRKLTKAKEDKDQLI